MGAATDSAAANKTFAKEKDKGVQANFYAKFITTRPKLAFGTNASLINLVVGFTH
jgi:hypothetical protein